MSTVLEREEYIEQSYLFRVLRERIAENVATQVVLERIHEEILATTRLPLAIQFLVGELKHTGLLSTGFQRLGHYFTPFQAFVIQQTENEKRRFTLETGLLVLEREAHYRANQPTPAGLFVYHLETLSRNRLGYLEGLQAMHGDPLYDDVWRAYVQMVQRQLGVVEIADLIYLRSESYVQEQQRRDAEYTVPVAPLFGAKEGRIARANLGRDPLYLFAALQRQLGYPEVPRPRAPDDIASKIEVLLAKNRELEKRLKMLEREVRGTLDLSEFLSKPELLQKPDEEEE